MQKSLQTGPARDGGSSSQAAVLKRPLLFPLLLQNGAQLVLLLPIAYQSGFPYVHLSFSSNSSIYSALEFSPRGRGDGLMATTEPLQQRSPHQLQEHGVYFQLFSFCSMNLCPAAALRTKGALCLQHVCVVSYPPNVHSKWTPWLMPIRARRKCRQNSVALIAETLFASCFAHMLSRCESRMLPGLASRKGIFQLDLLGTGGSPGLVFLESFGIGSQTLYLKAFVGIQGHFPHSTLNASIWFKF